jgi:hypothetical protein
MNLYEGDSSVFLEGIKVFRWWQCHVPETQLAAGKVNVLARLTDADHSPLLVERALEKGQGRVVLLTTSLDADWNAWPQEHASYVLFFQLLTRYVAQTTPQAGLIEIGQPIRVPLDAARHKREATLVRPDGEKTGLSAEQDQAAANAASGAKPEPAPQAAPPATAEAAWRLTTTETDAPGPYRIELTLRDGARESVLFAANLSGDDGNLEPLASASVKQQLQDSRVELLTADSLLAVSGSQSKSEWWLMVLGVVGIVLGAEQALAWLFGRRR